MYLLNEDEEEASAWSWGNPEMEDTVPISVKNFLPSLGQAEDDSDFISYSVPVLFVTVGAAAFYLWLRTKISEDSSPCSDRPRGTVIFVRCMVVILTLRYLLSDQTCSTDYEPYDYSLYSIPTGSCKLFAFIRRLGFVIIIIVVLVGIRVFFDVDIPVDIWHLLIHLFCRRGISNNRFKPDLSSSPSRQNSNTNMNPPPSSCGSTGGDQSASDSGGIQCVNCPLKSSSCFKIANCDKTNSKSMGSTQNKNGSRSGSSSKCSSNSAKNKREASRSRSRSKSPKRSANCSKNKSQGRAKPASRRSSQQSVKRSRSRSRSRSK